MGRLFEDVKPGSKSRDRAWWRALKHGDKLRRVSDNPNRPDWPLGCVVTFDRWVYERPDGKYVDFDHFYTVEGETGLNTSAPNRWELVDG